MKLYFDSQVDKDNEKIAKVLSEALNSHQLHNDENEEETCEELFIATVDGVPVAYSADSVTFSREYGYLVTTCALFSAVWHTIKHQTKQNGQLCIGTDHVAMYFMQFGYLLGVYKVNKPIPYDRIEISLRLIWTAFLFFFTPNISLCSWLQKHSSVFYFIQENGVFLSCLKEILYRERHRDPFYLIGAIRCMPSPYPEGRSRLYESLKPLLARGALHVLLYHCPSKCFVVACRQNNAVPLSADEMELFILLFKVAQECHSDILGYLQLERIYQQVNILFDSIGDDSEWLVLVVVKKKERDCVLKAWSQYKKDWTQQLQTGPIQKDLNGYLQNPLDCKIISYHLRLLFSVDVMFYYRGLHLLVYTEAWNTLLEKDNLKKVWTKEKVTDILVHKDKGHTWLCHSIGDNPPVNIVLFLPFESKEEYYMQLVKNIQNWFYHKQMSLFPFEWLEYFHGNNKPSIWKWF